MLKEQDNRDVWEKALDYAPAAGAAAAGYAAGRYLRKRRIGKKIETKVISIRPKRALVPTRQSGNDPIWRAEREVKYYVDKEGRRYQPAVYNEQTRRYEQSRYTGSRQYMIRDDGVVFKLRRDGKYVLTVPTRPPGMGKRRKRRK